ncbi:MAG: bifunctional glycosyltransferase family 2/GtrA family protein [Patescibacteria group bacterium]
MTISVIVPAYNEAKRIVPTLKAISDYFVKRNEDYELIVVDDGSRDNTRQVCESLGINELRVIDYGGNRGKGYAVNFGVKAARGDWILFTDADNSTPIEELDKLLPHRDSFDVLVGSRYAAGGRVLVKQPLLRRAASRFGNILVQLLLLPGIRDTQCGFKLFSRPAAAIIFERQTIFGWGFDMEILRIAWESGYRIKEVGVEWSNDEATRLQPSKVFLKTFAEMLRIKSNSLRGLYQAKKFSEGRRVVKFALVGAIGTLLDFAVLNLAIISFELNLYTAVSLGFIAGAVNNYTLNSLWSFEQSLTWRKFYSYVGISLVGLLLSNLIVFVFTDGLAWNYNGAKLVAVAVVFSWNYLMNRQLTFRATG